MRRRRATHLPPIVSGVWHRACQVYGTGVRRRPIHRPICPILRSKCACFCVRCMAPPLGESAIGSRGSEIGGGLTDTEPTEQGILPLFRYYTTFLRVCQYPPKKGKATDCSAAHDSVQPPAKSVALVPFAHLPPIRLSALIPPSGESISLCLSVARPAHFIGSGSGGYYPLPIQQS